MSLGCRTCMCVFVWSWEERLALGEESSWWAGWEPDTTDTLWHLAPAGTTCRRVKTCCRDFMLRPSNAARGYGSYETPEDGGSRRLVGREIKIKCIN